MILFAATGLCAAAAGVALAGCGGESAKPIAIDENAGRVGSVAIGDTREQVIRALGKPGGIAFGKDPVKSITLTTRRR